MSDPYLYPDSKVLKNLLGIRDESELNVFESQISAARMAILFEEGLSRFSEDSLKEVHKALFSGVYAWAGTYRIINIQKREPLLAGKSVWYSNADDIEGDLIRVWAAISDVKWKGLSGHEFAIQLARHFPKLWQIHPFREGNTRSIVMLIHLFTEHYGFYFDQELFAASAKYVRDAFVMACLDRFSEYEHLEQILEDAISTEPIPLKSAEVLERVSSQKAKYEKYRTEPYEPTPHEIRE